MVVGIVLFLQVIGGFLGYIHTVAISYLSGVSHVYYLPLCCLGMFIGCGPYLCLPVFGSNKFFILHVIQPTDITSVLTCHSMELPVS